MDEEEEAIAIDFRARGEFRRGGRQGILNCQSPKVKCGIWKHGGREKHFSQGINRACSSPSGVTGSWCNSLGPRASLLSSSFFFFLIFIWLH